MAQSQVLKARYLWLRPESELSSAEPFHSSPTCLSAGQPPMGLSARLGLPDGPWILRVTSCESQRWRTHQSRDIGAHPQQGKAGMGKRMSLGPRG